jgi:hypothetical protein
VRLQQSVQSLQTTPSTPWQSDGPVGGVPHVPSVAPDAMLHKPLQQSPALLQTSPTCAQYDDVSEHTPDAHRLEQHSPLLVHELPDVLHVVESGTHLPLVQLPLQQPDDAVHAALSSMHALALHVPPLHTRLQQSVATVHACPPVLHPAAPPPGGFVDPSPPASPPLHDGSDGSQLLLSEPPHATAIAPAAPSVTPTESAMRQKDWERCMGKTSLQNRSTNRIDQ